MSRVHVAGWRYGMEKVPTTQVPRDHLGIGLVEARSLTDRIPDGGAARLDGATEEAAEALASALRALGADATARPGA